jgi:FkbM family methyltransferase
MHLLSKLLEPGGTFIDVGANIGLYSLAAARIVGPDGRVLAFEPSPRERGLLERNVARNSLTQVVVDSRGLGNAENAQAVLHLADDQQTDRTPWEPSCMRTCGSSGTPRS